MLLLRSFVKTQVFWKKKKKKTPDTPATVGECEVEAVSLSCLLSDAAQAKP